MRRTADDIVLLTPADYRVVPWRNGGGTTREIAVHPKGAADFDWRLSIADVAASGPFSPFPGVARTIMLLDGDGMRLRFDERQVDVAQPFRPVDFDGGETTHCTLLGGAIRDFNIMSARARVRHAYEIVETFPHTVRKADQASLAVFALRGDCELSLDTGERVRLGMHATLLTRRSGGIARIESGDVVLLVQFMPRNLR